MFGLVAEAYRQIGERRPLVRPTYSQFEVALLPPFGDPEVYVLSELGTYVVAGLALSGVLELLHEE